MAKKGLIRIALVSAAVVSAVVLAQTPANDASHSTVAPQMKRLAALLEGDWNTSEAMERSEFFPQGGGRRGVTRWRTLVGGTALVGEGHSDGSAGPLDYQITIWWNNATNLYGYFTCFKDAGGSSCRVRGTAHWDGDTFVNDYDELEHGKRVRWRDSFVQFTPRSHVLIAARQSDDGTMWTLITSRSERR
jgi:hypothetical protein